MVLQDIHIDYQSTIYSIIIDTNEDQVKQQRTLEFDLFVWNFPKPHSN
jgi:hypothetical protein